jgi:hypothetical protein
LDNAHREGEAPAEPLLPCTMTTRKRLRFLVGCDKRSAGPPQTTPPNYEMISFTASDASAEASPHLRSVNCSHTSFVSFVIFVLKNRLHREAHEDHEGETFREGEAPAEPLLPCTMTTRKRLRFLVGCDKRSAGTPQTTSRNYETISLHSLRRLGRIFEVLPEISHLLTHILRALRDLRVEKQVASRRRNISGGQNSC